MSRLILFVLIFQISIHATKAQSSPILESYIKQGLENNYALKQKSLNLEKGLQALKEARGLFFPSVSLNAQYMLANGGRSADLPIGDLLNPVYSSLNQILEGMGQQGSFPQVENQKIQFLPNDYHDSKVRIVLPLVNAEIYYNHRLKKELINYSQAELNVYKRELVKEIKVSYLRYLQTVKVVGAYASALELVTEALRVNEKLAKNQMAGNDKLYRIKAELSQVQAQLTKAENDRKSAVVYFNFIINQPLQNPIVADSIPINNREATVMSITSESKMREELLQVKSAVNASKLYLNMKKAYWIPTISNITDLGYQGERYKFNGEQRYAMNIIDLKWTIFDGFQNRRRISQARIDMDILDKKFAETEHQLELQQSIAQGNLESSIKAENANLSSLASSKEYYKVVNRQYAEGQKSLLDLLDARNQLTNSQINYSVSRFETLIKLAELERAKAEYEF